MFIKALEGFKKSIKIVEALQFCVPNFKSKALIELCSINKGVFPDIISTIDHFDNLFDKAKALEKNFVIPAKGTHAAHDEVSKKIKELEKEANEYLKKIQKEVKNSSIKYLIKEQTKENYLIEVPSSVKTVPSYFQLKSHTKALNRYTTPEIQKIAKELEIEDENRKDILKNVFKDFLKEFDGYSKDWMQVIKCLSMLDCLVSLSKSSRLESTTCKAQFINSTDPFLDIKKMVNPCIKISDGKAIIPNDTILGTNDIAKCILLTGPNMYVKKTLKN